MRTPMMEKIVHTAKQTVKATVDMASALPLILGALVVMQLPYFKAHRGVWTLVLVLILFGWMPYARYVRAATLEAVGQLTAGVAHDFNNLLQAIRSGLYLLAPRLPDGSRKVLDASLQAVDRGEAAVAYIKLKPDQSVTDTELKHFLGDLLNKLEMPREIIFKDQLPRTLVGKLSKKELYAEEEQKRSVR